VYQDFLDKLAVNTPQTFDTSVFHKNGAEIPVEVRFVKRLEGKNLYIQSLIRDRTEKRLQELKLLHSEERLRLIFENVEDYIATLNEQGVFETINKTAQGLELKEVIGTSIYEFYDSKEKVALLKTKFKNLISTGENFEIEDAHTGPDGSTLIYNRKFIGIFDEQKFSKAILIIRDVTAEKDREHSVMNAVMKGQEQERRRLGAELHDGIGQVLSAIGLQVSQIKEEVDRKEFIRVATDMDDLTGKLQSAIREVRNISHDLMPEVLESFGLKEAVKQTCNNLQDRSGINVTFNHADLDNRYNQLIEVNLYRVAQELMTNIQRHAECENVFVSLIDHGSTLNLTVEDDGKGFESGAEKEFKGIGLSNVYSRVNLLGGDIDVESDVNSGTLVNIEVPKQIE
jgi:PAS domain S-box-containing protein